MRSELLVQKHMLAQKDRELETLSWYIKFYEDGRDIKKILLDLDKANK